MKKQFNYDNNSNSNEFDENGSRPSDFIDGMAITAVFSVIIIGILYYLYTM